MNEKNKLADSLGTRMKTYYEDRFRYLLTRRTYTIIRVDGKSFHTFTKAFQRPFDENLSWAMDYTCQKMCENIQGVKMGYVQSDEISIVLTDFDDLSTDAWFDNNLQKMCSVSASLATAYFNEAISILRTQGKVDITNLAFFDARVFQIPYNEEVVNYFIWREQDASRNSVSMTAQAHFSQAQLHGKKTNEMQDMLMLEKNINWNDMQVRYKRGAACIKVEEVKEDVVRKHWQIVDPPIFSQDRNFILDLFPKK